jgi:hypothetical protein
MRAAERNQKSTQTLHHEGPSPAQPQPKGMGVPRAKPAKIAKLKINYLGSGLRGLCALSAVGAKKVLHFDSSGSGQFAQAAQNFNFSSTKETRFSRKERKFVGAQHAAPLPPKGSGEICAAG